MHIILLVVSIVLNASAQLILKYGMTQVGIINSGTDFLSKLKPIVVNYWVWFGLFSYGLSFCLYLVVLSKIEVSRSATAAFTLVTILVFFFSALFLKESLTLTKVAGLVLCLAGCYLVLLVK